MKLNPLFIFLIFSCSFVPGSILALDDNDQDGKTNVKDNSGRKQGKWVYYGKDRPSEGYPEEGKIEEGPYKDDRKEGTWIKYYNDGVTPKLKGEYKNNRPEGPYVKINPKGIVIERGIFVKGKYIDSLVRYDQNGNLEYEGFYNESGNENGKIRFYYSNGQVEFEYNSDNGTSRGKAVRYYENGDVKEVIYYNAEGTVERSEQKEMVSAPVKINTEISKEKAPKIGQPRTKGAKFQPNGYNKVYNDNDEIWQDGEFRNSQLWNGKVYEYDRDGILLKVRVFKEGVYHSDGQL